MSLDARFLVSGAALLAEAALMPAEAATGSVLLHIVSAGFIFGVAGGGGVLRFGGRDYPLSIGGVSAGATIGASGADFVGSASNIHQASNIEGVYSTEGRRTRGRRRPHSRAVVERARCGSASERAVGRVHVFARSQRNAALAQVRLIDVAHESAQPNAASGIGTLIGD